MKIKEQWISETMESLDGIQPATGDPFIHDKIMRRLANSRDKHITLQPGILWQIAAGLALLITLNICSVVIYSKSTTTDQTQVKTLANEYFSYIDTIKF